MFTKPITTIAFSAVFFFLPAISAEAQEEDADKQLKLRVGVVLAPETDCRLKRLEEEDEPRISWNFNALAAATITRDKWRAMPFWNITSNSLGTTLMYRTGPHDLHVYATGYKSLAVADRYYGAAGLEYPIIEDLIHLFAEFGNRSDERSPIVGAGILIFGTWPIKKRHGPNTHAQIFKKKPRTSPGLLDI